MVVAGFEAKGLDWETRGFAGAEEGGGLVAEGLGFEGEGDGVGVGVGVSFFAGETKGFNLS